jgi:hypothetical protein
MIRRGQAPVPLDRFLLQGGLRFRPRLRFVASVPSVVLLMPQRTATHPFRSHRVQTSVACACQCPELAPIVSAWAYTAFPELRADRPCHQPGDFTEAALRDNCGETAEMGVDLPESRS